MIFLGLILYIIIFYWLFLDYLILSSFLILLFLFNLEGFVFNRLLDFNSFRQGLILLRLWIIALIILASFHYLGVNNSFLKFYLNLISIIILLFFCFSVRSFFVFYMSFEVVAVPTFFLILGWGYSVERLQAGLYIFIYTLLVSLPFLLFLTFIENTVYTLNVNYIYFLEKFSGYYWWVFVSLVFIVKLPIFFVHLWLPKAHVEAPLGGSIILAGVLLKLGGYGFFKSFFISFIDFYRFSFWLFRLRLFGSLIVRFVCLRQTDLKSLIAYSSVAHIGPVLCSLLTFAWVGWLGSFFIILAHGICSSGLFYILNLIYERWFSRRVLMLKGSFIIIPILSFWWFTFRIFSIGCPPSFNFISELLIIFSILRYHISAIGILRIILFIRGIYRVFLFVRFNHGFSVDNIFAYNLRIRENFLFLIHFIPLLMSVFFVFFICYCSLKNFKLWF